MATWKLHPDWHDANGDTPLHRVLKSRIVLDPTEFVKVLLAAGADASIRNAEGRTALDEALLQHSKNAETYFSVRTIGPKKLEQTIEILRSRLAPTPERLAIASRSMPEGNKSS